MKKLFAPILVLTLIVGFSALALGTVESSGSQTFTVDVSSAFSVTAPGTVTLKVGPNTTDSETKTLDYSYNDTTASSITVDVDIKTGSWPGGSMLTVDPPNSPAGGGTGNTLNISGTTTGATLISSLGDTEGDYTDTLDFSATEVDWDQSAGGSYDLTLTYKMVS